jgi:hypothetical protein
LAVIAAVILSVPASAPADAQAPVQASVQASNLTSSSSSDPSSSPSSNLFSSQDEPTHKAPAADAADIDYKWEAFVGFAYSSLNNVTRSRYGLSGIKAGATRDFGKHFGLTAEGSYYKYVLFGSSGNPNPGDPSLYSALAGPTLHADIYGRFSGFIHGLIGVEHSGGESQIPATSFAGGFGGGMEYKLRPRLSLRATGDDIGASFSPINNSPALGYSAHRTWNPQASISVVYHF